MRVAVALLALALAGCGVLDDEGPALPARPDPAVYGPAEAVSRAQPEPAAPRLGAVRADVGRALDGGAIGVVDLSGRATIRPSTLETASDATLERLRWTRWDAGGAEAAGELRLLDCQPTCAGGGVRTLRATIRLSGVTACGGRRYFARGEVRARALRPATYLRAPC